MLRVMCVLLRCFSCLKRVFDVSRRHFYSGEMFGLSHENVACPSSPYLCTTRRAAVLRSLVMDLNYAKWDKVVSKHSKEEVVV